MGAGGIPTRDYPEREATRDPIFLFQRRRYFYHWHEAHPSGVEFCWECEKVHEKGVACDVAKILDGAEMKSRGWAVDDWQTELVFFTREEGEAYGKARAYNYPDGWRVYCVPAEGKLADLLGLATFDRRTAAGA